MSDYHLHLHPHAVGGRAVTPDYSVATIERFVVAAAARGVTEVCLTEHYYRCVESAETLGPFWEAETPEASRLTSEMVRLDRTLSLDRYVEAVLAAKAAGLPVRLGLELDFFPATIERVVEHVAAYPFDFVVGAVHWIGGLTIDMAEAAPLVAARGLRPVWEAYAAIVEELGRGGHVDAVAHLDVLKKFGLRLPREPDDLYAVMVAALAEGGVALEVNSAGLRAPAREVYPSPTLLARANEAGIPITLGSDGHRPREAGLGIDAAVAAARAAGYSHHLRFDARRPRSVALPD